LGVSCEFENADAFFEVGFENADAFFEVGLVGPVNKHDIGREVHAEIIAKAFGL
jgi:hypothetical protein